MSSSIFYRANASFSSLKTSSSSSLATGIVVVASSSNPSPPKLPAGPAKKNDEKLEEEEEAYDATTIAATDKKVIETRILPFIGRCLHLSHQDHKNHENPGFAVADKEGEEEEEGEEEGADIRDLCIRMCDAQIFFPPKSIRLFRLGFHPNASHARFAETTRVHQSKRTRSS